MVYPSHEHRQRIQEWMSGHVNLWRDLDPSLPLYMSNREGLRVIMKGLQNAGLVSRKTGLIHIAGSLRRHIADAAKRLHGD